jgi:hypothetical protein
MGWWKMVYSLAVGGCVPPLTVEIITSCVMLNGMEMDTRMIALL